MHSVCTKQFGEGETQVGMRTDSGENASNRQEPRCISHRRESVLLSPFFICGEADRSGRGRCCSSCWICCCCWGIWGDCFQISHVQTKWVHPEKPFPKNGCIQRKLFLKMGASRENFSSQWVYPAKTFLKNGCIQSKL